MNTTRTAEARSAVLADLMDRLTARAQAGEALDPDALAAEHPEFADDIRRLVPALGLLAEVSGASRAQASLPAAAAYEVVPGVLGDFRIEREVGRGGMGVVYEAEQVSLRRRVALKVLPFAGAMDARALQRFKNEAVAAASLKHDHIVQVYGVGCKHGVHYIAMEFVEGHTLAQVIEGLRPRPETPTGPDATLDYRPSPDGPTAPVGALSTERSGHRGRAFYRTAAALVADAADALEHAHALGVVHRDVKPGNLLLDGSGKVYVADFGLARVGPDAGVTASGDLLGTLRYMAPEQALARHGLVDHRADVYGLGCVLYELLALRPAVRGGDRAEVLKAIAFEDPARPRKLDRSVPAELETIALKALEKNPAERYQSAKDLADDLRRFLADQTIRAKPPTLKQRVAKWARRHAGLVAAAAAVLLLVAVGATASTALVRLADLLADLGRPDDARAVLEEARRSAETGLRLARAREAATTPPDHARLWLSYAEILARLGPGSAPDAEAREALRRAEQAAADRDTRRAVAFFLTHAPDHRLRDPERAAALCRALIAPEPQTSRDWGLLGAAHLRAGRPLAAAIAASRGAGLKDPTDCESGLAYEWLTLAVAHRELGDPVGAALYYAAASWWADRNDPFDRDLRRLRAEAAELLGVPAPPPRRADAP